MMKFTEFLKDNIVVFDGAFGTMLQKSGKTTDTLPEKLNIDDPEAVAEIHRAYVKAGADVISANTFGANAAKAGEASDELIRAAVSIARKEANGRYVALDLGPTGWLTEPFGTASFQDVYEVFARAVKAGAGADLVLLETMSDLAELRAALLAVKENSDLPIIASMTFFENGRTFTGCDPRTFALTAAPFADVIGVNCSLGPDKLLPIVRELLAYTEKPVIVQANAGLPDADFRYSVGPKEFAAYCRTFAELGVGVIGGCCGTTPEYIKLLRELADHAAPFKRSFTPFSAVCSAKKSVVIDGVKIIGERINPTGKKAMKEALRNGDDDYIVRQAAEQAEAGADILDVNAGLPDLDEAAVLERLVKLLQKVTDLPLQIDSTAPAAVERALRAYCGKAVVNSVSGEDASLNAILPLVKKYGAAVIGLTIDERGIPKTAEERIRIAEKIISRAKEFGIPETDIFIDCLTLTAGAEQEQALNTLHAITEIKRIHNVKTVLGVSNISFGLPNRKIINAGFLNAALWAGLDLPILNPNVEENLQIVAAYNVLSGRDRNCAAYTEKYAEENKEQSPTSTRGNELYYCIKKGLPTAKNAAIALLDGGASPLDIIDGHLIPALNEVGEEYEKGKVFLPQLMSAAESAKLCFDEVKKRLSSLPADKGHIVLATVKGDVHDIGKNIAKTVLENYGYDITDLGRNVDAEDIVIAVKNTGAKLCGLSALMTTTVPNMQETIVRLKNECPDCAIMVGGAVLNEEFARSIGAHFYCKDANADIKIAKYVFENAANEVKKLN